MSLSRQFDKIEIKADSMASNIAHDFIKFRASMQPRFEDNKELQEYLFAESTRTTANGGKGGDGGGWSHSTHTPILKYIRKNLVSQYMRYLFSSRKWLELEDGTMEDQTLENIDKIEGYLTTKHRQSNFRSTIYEMVNDDLCVHGIMIGKLDWIAESNPDPRTGRPNRGYTGPKLSRIRPEDIAFNLRSTDFYNTHKIVRYLKTMGEIVREMNENPSLGWSQEAFEQAKKYRLHAKGGKQFEHDDSTARLAGEGINTWDEYFRSGEVEILEFYGDLYDEAEDKLYKNHVITVIDRLHVLRAEPLDTWSGRPHIFCAFYEKRRDCLWGQGPLETLVGMQYMINHIRNGVSSSMDKVLNPKWLQIGEVQLPDDFHAPDAIVRIDEAEGSFSPLAPDLSFLSALPQIDQLRAEMEMYSGSIDITRGLPTPGEQTLGEVNILNSNANSTFQDTVVKIERDFITPVVQAEIELANQYLNGTDSITMMGEEGTKEIMEITREDITTNGRVVAVGASHFIEKAKRIADLNNMLQTASANPEMKQHMSSIKLAELYEEAMDVKKGDLVSPFIAIDEQMEAQNHAEELQESRVRELEERNQNIDDEL